jgi:hypothetical protein
LKIDTVLLQDVWINFRRMCFKNYRLDPVYYISAPHLADPASLKITGQKLGLITEQKLYEIYEFGIRGGQSMIPHRYALAQTNIWWPCCIGIVKINNDQVLLQLFETKVWKVY